MEEKEGLIRIGLLTVSDSCYNGINRDTSGEFLELLINEGNCFPEGKVVIRMCVPDDFDQIEAVLLKWADVDQLDLIITAGGTGLSERDITPEVTKSILDKDAFGISTALVALNLGSTKFAMLSRPVCGVRNRTLILNFPGSAKACKECFDTIIDVIPHAVSVIKGKKAAIASTHEKLSRLDSFLYKSKVDINVSRRNRNSPFPLVTVVMALNLIIEKIKPLPLFNLTTRDALGYVLGLNVYAVDSIPAFPASMKDGYAVLSTDGTLRRRVISHSVIGSRPFSVPNMKYGECIRVTTGAPVPYPTDAVVQVEDTSLILASEDCSEELEIEINKTPIVGQDIRQIGCDMEKGSLVLNCGTCLSSGELGILASVGIPSISVYKKPVISVFSTGSELINPGERMTEGKVRDCNRTTLLALLEENGFPANDAGIAVDEPDIVFTKLKKALEKSDVIITSGGASMGEHDILASVLVEDLGATIHFGRVFMKPGKPTKFATVIAEDKLKYIFVLPGNPVSAVVTCHLFVLPALKALSGHKKPFPDLIKTKISCDIKLDERNEYQRATLEFQSGHNFPVATPTGKQASSRLLSMLSANCLLHLPCRTETENFLSAGSIVDAQIIGKI